MNHNTYHYHPPGYVVFSASRNVLVTLVLLLLLSSSFYYYSHVFIIYNVIVRPGYVLESRIQTTDDVYRNRHCDLYKILLLLLLSYYYF